MALADVLYARVKQGEPAVFLARVRTITGAYITQATVSAMTYTIFDLVAGTSTTPASITVSSAVFDALVVDPVLFPVDSTGYNVKWVSPQTAFPNSARAQKYRVEIKLTMTDSAATKFTLRWNVDPDPVLSAPL